MDEKAIRESKRPPGWRQVGEGSRSHPPPVVRGPDEVPHAQGPLPSNPPPSSPRPPGLSVCSLHSHALFPCAVRHSRAWQGVAAEQGGCLVCVLRKRLRSSGVTRARVVTAGEVCIYVCRCVCGCFLSLACLCLHVTIGFLTREEMQTWSSSDSLATPWVIF